jgi:hypothetical protein
MLDPWLNLKLENQELAKKIKNKLLNKTIS